MEKLEKMSDAKRRCFITWFASERNLTSDQATDLLQSLWNDHGGKKVLADLQQDYEKQCYAFFLWVAKLKEISFDEAADYVEWLSSKDLFAAQCIMKAFRSFLANYQNEKTQVD